MGGLKDQRCAWPTTQHDEIVECLGSFRILDTTREI